MRVLLFSNDLMPFGNLPTSGGGLRCWQLMKGLESRGIEVLASMPGFTYLAEKHYEQIPEPQRELLWRWETQDEILRRTKPDAVLFASNWDHYGLAQVPDVPLIIDLHGSRLIETSMWDCPVDTDRKVQILGKADCLLCAGVRQRSYFYGWLMQAGRVPEFEHFIRYIPVSLSPEIPEHHYPEIGDPKAPRMVSGGGWFPWQNQAKTIFHICREIEARNAGTIDIFGTPHETQGLSSEERFIRDIYGRVKSLAENSERINVHGYIGREELLKIYRTSSLAVEAMEYNLERELAFTTRTIEYLWCGLPVLYNDFGEVSEHIKEYDAGWTVDPADEQSIKAAVEEIFERPELLAQKGRNAQRLVQERFSWDKTIEPLVNFLENPKKAAVVQPATGQVRSRSSFLNPRGTAIDIPLHSSSGKLAQTFVVPAENIARIQVPVALRSTETRKDIESISLAVYSSGGRALARKQIPGEELPLNGTVELALPLLFRPAGGTRLRLEISGSFRRPISKDESPVIVRGLLEGGYPFVDPATGAVRGKSLLGQELEAKSLSLSFLPGAGRLYRVKSICERVYWMMRNGEWERLRRAGMRRLPTLMHRVRRLAFG